MASLVNAYTQGVTAHDNGHSWGINPYDPQGQPRCYEAWIDGWSAKDNWVGDKTFDAVSESVGRTIEKELL